MQSAIAADASSAVPIVHETLPVAAQYGILGILCLALAAAVAYLVWKLDRVRELHSAELQKLTKEHSAELAAIQAERVRETGEYAQALGELFQPVKAVVGQVEELAESMSDEVNRRRRRSRSDG